MSPVVFKSSKDGPDAIFAWARPSGDGSTRTTIPLIACRTSVNLQGRSAASTWRPGSTVGGISNGTAAGTLICDQVQGRANPWSELYNPRRRAPKKYNKGGDSQSYVRSIDDVPRGHGGVLVRGKSKLAIWKSANGRVHALSGFSCTHAGCTVTWNNAELTWDCPCHGSMFSPTGEVLHGPAMKPLARKKSRIGEPVPATIRSSVNRVTRVKVRPGRASSGQDTSRPIIGHICWAYCRVRGAGMRDKRQHVLARSLVGYANATLIARSLPSRRLFSTSNVTRCPIAGSKFITMLDACTKIAPL